MTPLNYTVSPKTCHHSCPYSCQISVNISLFQN